MRVFKTTYKARDGRTKQARKWYVEVRDHLSTIRRFPAFTDKAQSEALGRQIERLVAFRIAGEQLDPLACRWLEQVPELLRDKFVSIGLLESTRAAAGKPLLVHIADFRQALLDKGDTEQQAKQVSARVRRIVDGCKFRSWTDIQASRVQRYIAKLREGDKGISCQTANFYLQAIKQFGRWMVDDKRAGESPVAHLKGFKAGEIREDRRHPRRALEVDEARRLLEAASRGPARLGMTGPERSMLYRIAIETGLRAGELRSLTVSSFDLGGLTVTVEARHSKRRRQDTLPLRPETAGDLRVFFAGKLPKAKAFRMPHKDRVSDMIQADLAEAGIPYVDESGRYADFHGLRHTTGSFLAAAGVHPKVAQEILRHSRIELTMNIYTHTLHGQQSEAVAKLPDLSVSPAEAQKATGTDGNGFDSASCLARHGGKQQISVDDNGQETDAAFGTQGKKKGRSEAKNGVFASETAETGEGGIRTRGRGVYPYDGLANRCLQPLGHLSKPHIVQTLTDLNAVTTLLMSSNRLEAITKWASKGRKLSEFLFCVNLFAKQTAWKDKIASLQARTRV